MNANKVITLLLGLGITANQAFSLARANDRTLDWVKFMSSPEFAALKKALQPALQSITGKDLTKTLKSVRAKQKDFLDGRQIAQLSSDELLQFNDLADVEVLLVNKRLKELKASAAFLSFLVDEALPVLLRAAKSVIKLLL